MKIICVGKNYLKHIDELNSSKEDEPVIFLKPEHIESKFSNKYFNQISLGIDFTARDFQNKFKERGLPWDISKGFDNSALIGDWKSIKTYDLDNINFRLEKNGKIVQQSNSKNMIWKIDELIAYASKYFTIKIGDIMFTGTPEGVGVVSEDDVLEGFLGDEKVFSVKIK